MSRPLRPPSGILHFQHPEQRRKRRKIRNPSPPRLSLAESCSPAFPSYRIQMPVMPRLLRVPQDSPGARSPPTRPGHPVALGSQELPALPDQLFSPLGVASRHHSSGVNVRRVFCVKWVRDRCGEVQSGRPHVAGRRTQVKAGGRIRRPAPLHAPDTSASFLCQMFAWSSQTCSLRGVGVAVWDTLASPGNPGGLVLSRGGWHLGIPVMAEIRPKGTRDAVPRTHLIPRWLLPSLTQRPQVGSLTLPTKSGLV